MKITRENLKNIVIEAMIEENEYQEFFKKALEKTGKSIPDMSDEEKKAFFNKIDAAWKGKGEKKESVDMDIDEEAVVVSKRTPEGNIVSKLKEELTDAQKKLPPALQKAIAKKKGKKEESVSERMGSDKGAVGNANFNNRLKAMRDDKNSVVAFIDTNKGKKLLKVFKTQQTAKQFTKKNMDKLLNTKGVESVGTMSKKEWDAKEAKYAIESVNEGKFDKRSLLKMILKHDDAMITTNRGKEYIIYNPNSNNKDNADMWKGNNSVFAVDKNGDEHEIKYSDITSFKA